MKNKMMIPFGPHHPALVEPFQLDLIIEGERVVEAVPSVGFVHRGIEKLAEKKSPEEMIRVMERASGLTSFSNSWLFCAALENAMDVTVPERGEYLRTIMLELERVQNHLYWICRMCDITGNKIFSGRLWNLREEGLEIIKRISGNRIIHSMCRVGGMEEDINNAGLRELTEKLEEFEVNAEDLVKLLMAERTFKKRLEGAGALTGEEARDLCVVGPVARSSGIHLDSRVNGTYGVYDRLDFEPCIEESGDAYGRFKVRIGELFRSLSLIEKAVEMIPEGPVNVSAPETLEEGAEGIFRLEQPGGEGFCYVMGGRDGSLARVRVRAAGNMNFPAMVRVLQDCDLADVPILVHSFDPDMCGMER